MLRNMKDPKSIMMISILSSIVLSLAFSTVYAESFEQPTTSASTIVQEKELNLIKPTLESDKQQVITRLKGMNHELNLLQSKAFELGNIDVAKEIEQIKNELIIERTELLQGSPKMSAENTDETLLIQSVRFQEIEEKFFRNISQYKELLGTSFTRSGESSSIAKVGDGQIVPAGSEASVSLKTATVRDKVTVQVLDFKGIIIVSQSYDEPTDYPNYTWSVSPKMTSGSYTIVLKYPGTSEVEDTFIVYVSPVPLAIEIKEDTSVDAEFPSEEYNVYKFTPSESKTYQISTGAYAGGESTSDTWLGLYEDANLNTLIRSNGDINSLFSEITAELTAGTPYYIALKNNNKVDARMTITAFIVPLTAPQNFRIQSKQGATAVTLSWDTSTENMGVVEYDIYQGSTLVGSVDETTMTYTVTGLAGNARYSFTVKAKDAAGNISPASNTVLIFSKEKLKYTYDSLGRLESITLESTGEVIKSFHYDQNGNLVGTTVNK